jgi:hypothetical protein
MFFSFTFLGTKNRIYGQFIKNIRSGLWSEKIRWRMPRYGIGFYNYLFFIESVLLRGILLNSYRLGYFPSLNV